MRMAQAAAARSGLTYLAGPQWSPDGRRIVLAQTRGYPFRGAIYTIAPAESKLRRVSSEREGQYLSPAWSPDGREILFSRLTCRLNGFCGAELRSINLATGKERRLVRISGAGANPASAWSPDGKTILIAGGRPGIWSMSQDARQTHSLTRNYADFEPTWSPDGTRIAFTRYDQVNGGRDDGVFVTSLDGRGTRRVARGSQPAWQPAR